MTSATLTTTSRCRPCSTCLCCLRQSKGRSRDFDSACRCHASLLLGSGVRDCLVHFVLSAAAILLVVLLQRSSDEVCNAVFSIQYSLHAHRACLLYKLLYTFWYLNRYL